MFREKKDYKLGDEDIFNRLMTAFSEENARNKIGGNDLIFMYKISIPDFQHKIKEHILDDLRLVNTPRLELWFDALNENILDSEGENEMPTHLLSKFEKMFDSIKRLKFDEGGEAILEGSVEPFNITYKFSFALNNKRLNEKTMSALMSKKTIPLLYKWLIDPNKFTYNKFNPFWLNLVDNKNHSNLLDEKTKAKIANALNQALKNKYNADLAKVYIQYYT